MQAAIIDGVMSAPRRHQRYTYADYVALETVSVEKHEFMDGEIFVMAGGSADHARLSAQMVRLLGNVIGDGTCDVFTSDLRVFVETVGLATYPDASVICGPLQQHDASPESTALNPTVLVEVTSNSSEEYDRGLKREYYQTIESLRDYVIVSHRERRINVYARGNDGAWTIRTAASGERVEVPSLQAQLAVDEVYRNSSIV